MYIILQGLAETKSQRYQFGTSKPKVWLAVKCTQGLFNWWGGSVVLNGRVVMTFPTQKGDLARSGIH